MGISIDEKRVYDASEGPTPVYVVGDFGVARVNTSDDLVGEFGLSHRCTARDAAGRGGRVVVATDEDVLVGTATGDADETEFQSLGVGPAVAVGFVADGGRTDDEEELLIVREEGTVIRSDGVFGNEATEGSSERRSDGEEWTELGDLADEQGRKDEQGANDDPADVRAVDGDLVATASGIYRAANTDLQHVGLEDVRDVSTAGVPLAATASGLYRLGNGWMDELDGDFHAVSAVGADSGSSAGRHTHAHADTLGWAHAASADGLLGYEGGENEEGEWQEVELPVEGEVVALDHGGGSMSGKGDRREGAYAVTDDGTFLLSVGDGWNYQILGLRGVRAVASP